ncbi:MAG TPA: GlsB/YeaQ/YmgE family stress response membrane protein [Thermoanaerobaculia bacterium]|nr:GlsB/YeaQ/YmgE family stress response membrane protein [Thermoanaerobaculia bacterium]
MEAGMGLIAWVVLGLIAGLIAKALMPGKDPGGCVITVIIGIVGALLGGFLATALGFGGISGFDLRSIFIAILGAFILLAIWRMIRGRGRRT